MIIRNEIKSDIEAIFEITRRAFENHPHSDHTEQFILLFEKTQARGVVAFHQAFTAKN
jgi:predicted N-acetyltransferase YhbS